MGPRAASWLAWSLAGISVAMFVAAVALFVLARSAQKAPESWDAFGELLVFVPFLAFPIVGALIASRRPENPIGWMCLVAGIFWVSFAAGDQYDAYVLAKFGSVPDTVTLDALTQWTWVPPWGFSGST
jgi:hypothetical protein